MGEPFPTPALGGDEVGLWRVPLDVDTATLDTLACTLSPDEQARASRLHFERDRLRWTASRGWLRRLLAGYLGARPSQLRFEWAQEGKPRLTGEAGWLRFNLSHSADAAVIAVAREREVGVDIEAVRPASRPVPARFLCEAERAALARLPARQLERASLQCWAAKEAYLKAVGVGLRGPVAEIDVAALIDALACTMHSTDGAEWSLQRLDAGPGLVGAIAVSGTGIRVPQAAVLVS